MIKYERNKTMQKNQTRLFFRGIRFDENKREDIQYLCDLIGIPDFNCDINIMSGKAEEFLEINRERVKRGSFNELRGYFADCFDAFYEEVIRIIENSDKGEQIFKALIDFALSSKAFSRQLWIHIVALHGLDFRKSIYESWLDAMSLIDVAWFDMAENIVNYCQEPIKALDFGVNEPRFVDYYNYETSTTINLVATEHYKYSVFNVSSNKNGQGNVCFIVLRNMYPFLYRYKYGKLLTFEAKNGSRALITIYTLTKSLEYTYMDEMSYYLIINQIIVDCENRAKEGEVSKNYFPVFPAFKCDGIQSDLISIFDKICIDKPPVDTIMNTDRYSKLVLSPLPISILMNYIKKPNKSISVQLLSRLDEFASYYETLFTYIISNTPQSNEVRDKNIVIDSCQKFYVYLVKLFKKYDNM